MPPIRHARSFEWMASSHLKLQPRWDANRDSRKHRRHSNLECGYDEGNAPFLSRTDKVNSLLFSPDGSCLLGSSDTGCCILYDAFEGKQLLQLGGHRVGSPTSAHISMHSAAISHDGSRIVAGASDGTATVWTARARSRGEAARPSTEPATQPLAATNVPATAPSSP